MSEVLVIAETTAAGVRKPTLELLTAARALGGACRRRLRRGL